MSACFKYNYPCFKQCIQLKMLEFHLPVGELPDVLAILTMVVKVTTSQKSPLVNQQSCCVVKRLQRQIQALLKLMMVLLFTLMASEFLKIISVCPKICFLRALCTSASLLALWHCDLGHRMWEFAKGREQLIENFLSGPQKPKGISENTSKKMNHVIWYILELLIKYLKIYP